MTGMLRSFVALDLPEEIADELAAMQELFPLGREVSWENLHLTLAFLGDQPRAALAEADAVLSALRMPAFEMRLSGLEAFGGRTPRAIVARAAPSPDLMALEDRVTRALRQAGLAFQRQRFRPHVTLLRLPRSLQRGDVAKLRDRLEAAAGFRGTPFRAASVTLRQSTLTPDGPVYAELGRYDLLDG